MSDARDRDREALLELDRETLLELLFHQIRNIWRVDGLYFLGIEKRFGLEAATEVDAECWAAMATLEARSLRTLLGLGEGLEPLARALAMTSWAWDDEVKELESGAGRVVFRVMRCRTQLTRLRRASTSSPADPSGSAISGPLPRPSAAGSSA